MPLPDDVRAHRQWLLSFCELPKTGALIDLGCGKGDDVGLLAASHAGAERRFFGLDAARESIAAAVGACAHDPRVAFAQHRFVDLLPFSDASFDVVYSNNLLECIGDKPAFARESARILRPGGVVVAGHWDWDSQAFDGTDKNVVRRLVHAFADCQQSWMDHADGWMGRRMWGLFQSTGLFDGEVYARVLTNTSYAAPWYGYARAQDFRTLVDRGLASSDDYLRFCADNEALNAEKRYFYSITGYAYVGRRRVERGGA
jgi:SAM-dependent methyltransferase